MKKVRIILAAAVLTVIALGFVQLTVQDAEAAVMQWPCEYYCQGRWCSGWQGACTQLCGGELVLLDCNQFCGKHC